MVLLLLFFLRKKENELVGKGSELSEKYSIKFYNFQHEKEKTKEETQRINK